MKQKHKISSKAFIEVMEMKGGEQHAGYRGAPSIADHAQYFVRVSVIVFVDLYVDFMNSNETSKAQKQ